MVRLSERTHARVMQLSTEEFPGTTADEVIQRLLDEHWQVAAIAAAARYREEHPEKHAEDMAEAGLWHAAAAPVDADDVA
nr:hypothetical protein Ade03nite_41060 [Actinoplanes derwentensis]